MEMEVRAFWLSLRGLIAKDFKYRRKNMPVRITRGDPIDDTWATFHMTYQSVGKCADDTFAKIGLSHQQFQVLRAIKEIPGTVTLTAVANWLDRNPNSITLIIDRMGKGGLVKRVRDLEDRRAVRLVITPKGKKIYEQVDTPANGLPGKILSVLTEEELLTFVGLLQKIREKTFELRHIKDKVSNVII
jgi:DNA-binding MarR family transcriptional regulator